MARTRFGPGAGDEDTLQDADNDTKVTVEANADEDKIRFFTAGTERMIVDAGGFVGIGTSVPTEILTLNAASQGEPTISFKEEDTEMGTIGINASQNILIENKTSNKHIVFKASDAGVSREGLRLDGAVPEVVVNQTSDSLVDFRVESDNNTHMLYVDGANDRVGIGESAPQTKLHVNGTLLLSSSVNLELLRIAKADGDTREIAFENEGVDIGSIYFNSAEHMFIRQENSSLDLALRVGTTNAVRIDGSASRVGIYTDAPRTKLHMHSDSSNEATFLISQANSDSDGPQIDLSKARGTDASPNAVVGDDFVGQIRFLGYDGNSYDNFADIYAQATGSITTTSHPTKMFLRTTRSGATSPTVALTIDENQNLDVAGNLSYPDIIMAELSIPGVDVQTDTNAFRFNCPYNLDVTGLGLALDQHSTSGDVTVTVTNTSTSSSMITFSLTGTALGGSTTSVSNASCDVGQVITVAITATPANAQGLRATIFFRRRL